MAMFSKTYQRIIRIQMKLSKRMTLRKSETGGRTGLSVIMISHEMCVALKN